VGGKGAAARGANLYGALRRQCYNRKYGAVKISLPHAKKISPKTNRNLDPRIQKMFVSLVLDRKS